MIIYEQILTIVSFSRTTPLFQDNNIAAMNIKYDDNEKKRLNIS